MFELYAALYRLVLCTGEKRFPLTTQKVEKARHLPGFPSLISRNFVLQRLRRLYASYSNSCCFMEEISFNPAHVAQPSCTLNTDDFDDDDISINPSYLENLNQNAINITNPTTRRMNDQKYQSNYDLFNEIVRKKKRTLSLQQKLKRKREIINQKHRQNMF